VRNQKGTWTNIYWNAIPQTPADIAAMRQRLETKGIPSSGAQLAPGAQPGYGPSPHQQIQGAPNPQYYPNAGPALGGAAPAPTGVPPGGFLGNLPQNGNGGSGNQGGGSW
jgi:hypothetical protein